MCWHVLLVHVRKHSLSLLSWSFTIHRWAAALSLVSRTFFYLELAHTPSYCLLAEFQVSLYFLLKFSWHLEGAACKTESSSDLLKIPFSWSLPEQSRYSSWRDRRGQVSSTPLSYVAACYFIPSWASSCPVGEGSVETAERKGLWKLQKGHDQSWEQSELRREQSQNHRIRE